MQYNRNVNRRTLLLSGVAAAGLAACGQKIDTITTSPKGAHFPDGFIWGAATAGHQVEGQNTNTGLWYLENLPHSAFAEPSGRATNSYELWETDLNLVKDMGLNAYRFSIEWARIEPTEGTFSAEAIAHYRAIIDGCIARGLKPLVTYQHFTAPLWFDADGGWTNPQAPTRFATYCAYITRELGENMAYVITMNEPQLLPLLDAIGLPDFVHKKNAKMLEMAEAKLGVKHFAATNVARQSDQEIMQKYLLEGHVAGRNAIKAVRPDLPVGVSIAIIDDMVGGEGGEAKIKQVRAKLYDRWTALAKDDDFLGIQNYERKQWTKDGFLPGDPSLPVNFSGAEVYAPSLAGAVRYAYAAAGVPILVTEHGVGTTDDSVRQEFIPEALKHLKMAMDDGVPVIGYCHWSLLDNFEWVFGYGPKFGLIEVNRETFKRTPKPSAAIYGKIAKANILSD